MDIEQLLVAVPKINPTAQAVESEGRWWSWQEFSAVSDSVLERLTEAGAAEGVRVGLLLRNRAQHLACLMGCVISHRCAVAFNPILPAARLAEDVRTQKPAMLIGAECDFSKDVTQAADELDIPILLLSDGAADQTKWLGGRKNLREQGPDQIARDVMLEMLSSGTTGTPKRIPLKRDIFNQSFKSAQAYEKGHTSGEPVLRSGVRLQTAPLTHISGMFTGLMTIAEGRKIALMEKFTVNAWVEAVERVKPRIGNLPPAALRMILDANVPKERLESLVALRSGTAPLDPVIIDAFQERYGLPVLVQYGATEFAGSVAGWDIKAFKELYASKRGSVGRIQSKIEARIVEPETGEPLAPGEPGILELRGRQLGDEIRWVRTTDRAKLDSDNYLWILGRADNAINRGGFKIHPDDVVKALEEHPAVREAVVVGVADARLGETPAAALILAANCREPAPEELRAFLAAKLAPYQIPVTFKFIEELPRTTSLKPNLPEVRKLFAGEV